MAIEAYKYLCSLQDRKPDNTGHSLPTIESRKRKLDNDKIEFENGKHSRMTDSKPTHLGAPTHMSPSALTVHSSPLPSGRKSDDDDSLLTFTIGNNDNNDAGLSNNLPKILPKMKPSR